jgi:RNA polymerase sigma-B factor
MPATAELGETTELIARYQADHDPRLRDELVRRHLRLVKQVARSYGDRCRDGVDDLVQVGSIGLLNALDRFDPHVGRNFEAYAGTLIAGEIKHYIRDSVHLVRPPRELVELRSTVRAATSRLSQENDRTPTVAELASETGLDASKVEEVLALDTTTHTVSLDDEGDDDGEGLRPKVQLVDNKYRSFQLATEDRIMLAQAMGRMRSVSREVIEFAFYQDLTQTEIAQRLGISQMQVSRRLKAATQELWKALNTRLW